MSRKNVTLNPLDWFGLAMAQQRLMFSASETIWRRMMLMGAGTMSPVETMSMVFEKPAAFAKGFEKASIAAARGRPMPDVAEAFLKPVVAKASSNAKRLRG